MPSKPCVDCSRSVPIFSGSRCHACAATWGAANGLSADLMPKACPVEGCVGYVMRRGYCDRHYRRFIDHGTTDKVRTVNEDRLHPEYKNWQWLKRQGKLCPEWQLFHIYVEAVGERPSPRHWADRPRVEEAYGPDNFQWTAPKLDQEYNVNSREGRQAYQQALRAKEPRYWVGENLKRYFGLTRVQYEEILMSQGGTCALCDKTEDTVDGKPRLLSVDHDHRSLEVRGILCHSCNVALGHFQDNPNRLRKAATYLECSRTGFFTPAPGDVIEGERKRGFSAPGQGKVCSEPGCANASKAKGLCPTHYQLFRRNNTTETGRVQGVCSVEDCGRSSRARGLCNTHYEAAWRAGTLPPLVRVVGPEVCSMDGCEKPSKAHGLCMTHYKRMKRHGSADIVHNTRGELLTDTEMRTTPA